MKCFHSLFAIVVTLFVVCTQPLSAVRGQRRNDLPDKINAAFFANWAQYRPDPYSFVPSDMSSIVGDLDIVYYGFAYFCPNSSMGHPYWEKDPLDQYCQAPNRQPFDIIWIEPMDPTFYADIIDFKNTNSDLKVILSIGGWNFPSNYFSQMVSTAESRAAFIKSVKNITSLYGFDGIDFDWEYPGSLPRMDPVEIKCDLFKFVYDTGGSTDPAVDKANFVTLLKEMREDSQLADILITICSQAGLMHVDAGFDLENLVKYLDLINIMSYDYTVSATNLSSESEYTAPNEPLYEPSGIENIAIWNVNSTVNGYIARGAPADQILIGLAYYGHTWYIPDLTVDDPSGWDHYGIQSTKPGELSNCCNITKFGYGGSAGHYTLQCGFNAYFELQLAGFPDNAIIDNQTMTYISYLDSAGQDGWTPANTWINYQGVETIKAIIDFTSGLGLRGAFAFDLSLDGYENDAWTFELTKQMITCVNDGCESAYVPPQ